MMLGLARALKEAGVLGINRRNADFTLAYNPRRYYPLVDDKLLTKDLARKAGAAVPDLYGVVEANADIKRLRGTLSAYDDFVIKPAQGSQGQGIVVVTGRMGDHLRLADGSITDRQSLEFHISNILAGIYSLGGQPDKALIEYRVKFNPVFERISFRGVPDVRIIVFLGVPVMAMVRLPTAASGGKANLHQGAIGAGVDIASGRTLTAVWRNEIVEVHPDTGNHVSGAIIPHWPRLLDIAARSYEMTGLGYQGIDLVLDADLGPLILELNARPGLNIQIANSAGLLPRLEMVQSRRDELSSVADRVAFAQAHFGAGGGRQAETGA